MSNYLSIVAASRNDNHGGDMTRRMQLFVNGLIEQCNKFNFPAELIMVDWNPPAGRPPLSEVLPQPKAGDKLSVRYITVPPEVHASYLHSKTIPLYQMIAKNVGIRRAKGEFILCTNVDLLFSDSLIKELAERKLEEGKYYRANRCDVPRTIPESLSVDEQLKWCEENVMTRQGYDSRYLNMVGLPFLWVYKFPLLVGALNFLAGEVRSRLSPERFRMQKIDCMACGDFTLMSKSDWIKIDGYLEMDLYSIHIDTMALNACNALGIEQVIFPLQSCTYHIDHEEGWSSMNPLKVLNFLERRPGMDWHVMMDAGRYIIRNKVNYGINKPDWGFANQRFEETVFNPFE